MARKKKRAKRKPLYGIWEGMRARCHNPKYVNYRLYGARGIYVCDRWRYSYENFFHDMSPRPSPQHSIDRIDNDGPYSPENCRWADQKTQTRNKRDTIWVTIEGQKYLAVDLAQQVGIKTDTLVARVKRGLTYEQVTSREHFHDKSGLALGGRASGAKQQARTHCNRGHEFTPENTTYSPEGWRRCKKCCCIRTKECRDRKLAA